MATTTLNMTSKTRPDKRQISKPYTHAPLKPLYTPLAANEFRLLHVKPGSRRGDFTLRLIETTITTAAHDYRYAIVTFGPSTPGRPDLNDTMHFPIRHRGSLEADLPVQRGLIATLEKMASDRWDAFYGVQTGPGMRRAWWNGKARGHADIDWVRAGGGTSVDFEGETVGFYLWVKDLCVNRGSEDEGRRQEELLAGIVKGARAMITVYLPTEIGGLVEYDRDERNPRAKTWVVV